MFAGMLTLPPWRTGEPLTPYAAATVAGARPRLGEFGADVLLEAASWAWVLAYAASGCDTDMAATDDDAADDGLSDARPPTLAVAAPLPLLYIGAGDAYDAVEMADGGERLMLAAPLVVAGERVPAAPLVM